LKKQIDMTHLVYYQKYTDKVDQCLSIANNPELAKQAGSVLLQIMDVYRKMPYGTFHFEGHYDSLFLSLEASTREGDIDKLIEDAKIFFDDDKHNDLQKLAIKLDRLVTIYQTSDEQDLREKISQLLNRINDENYLTHEDIDNYYRYAQSLIDEHNYSSSSTTVVVEKKQNNKGCLVSLLLLVPFLPLVLILLIPTIIVQTFKN